MKMGFSQTPDHILLQIFQKFPLEEKISLGLVNERFYRIFSVDLSFTKSLDLGEKIFRKLTPDSLRILLTRCSKKLERLSFPATDFGQRTSRTSDLINAFSQFSCPKLATLDLGKARLDAAAFGEILKNNSALRELGVHFQMFPEDLVSNDLEILKGDFDPKSLQSYVGRCPNLKRFDGCLELDDVDDDDDEKTMDWLDNEGVDGIVSSMVNALDAFFKSCPKMGSFKGNDLSRDAIFALKRAKSFWKLEHMRELAIYQREDDDEDVDGGAVVGNYELLSQIGGSFKNLGTLELYMADFGISNNGVASLTNCKKLKKIKLARYNLEAEAVNIDEAMRSLPQCGELEEIRVACCIDSTTLTCVVHHCQKLKKLSVAGITDVRTIKKAVSIVKAFSGFGKKDLEIGLLDKKCAKTWTSLAVSRQLKKMERENTSGIKFVNKTIDV